MAEEVRDPWPGLIRLGILALVGVLAIWAVFTIIRGPVAGAEGGAGGEAAGSTEPFEGTIHLTEFAIEGQLEIPAGDSRITVVNDGAVAHNLVFRDGTGTTLLNPGESEVLSLNGMAAGTFAVICDVPGHEAAGMVASLVVSQGDVAASEHSDEVDYEALDRAMEESILEFPAETAGLGNALLEPTVLSDGTKEFRLTTEITPWEVEPGKFVDAWTYNGIVPGPMIKLDLGDKVRVVVQNNLPMGTDVHWHGIDTPNSMDGVAPITQPLIHAGEEFVYEFTADAPAIGMYHAHHHAQMQVPNGMFGVMIIGDNELPEGETISGVEIPNGIEIAGEIPMVLNDAGVIGYSLNGKSFPATQPYVFDKGDWIVIHYYNEGLQIHPMHLHQFGQLIFAKDGFTLEHPYWADTINVAPGERYSVLMHADAAGAWVWHCHILNHVEREEGMFGMVTALIVQET